MSSPKRQGFTLPTLPAIWRMGYGTTRPMGPTPGNICPTITTSQWECDNVLILYDENNDTPVRDLRRMRLRPDDEIRHDVPHQRPIRGGHYPMTAIMEIYDSSETDIGHKPQDRHNTDDNDG